MRSGTRWTIFRCADLIKFLLSFKCNNSTLPSILFTAHHMNRHRLQIFQVFIKPVTSFNTLTLVSIKVFIPQSTTTVLLATTIKSLLHIKHSCDILIKVLNGSNRNKKYCSILLTTMERSTLKVFHRS